MFDLLTILLFLILIAILLLATLIYYARYRPTRRAPLDPSRLPPPDSEEAYPDPQTKTTHKFPSLNDPPSIDLTIVVPAYNEMERLPAMMNETLGYLDDRSVGNVRGQLLGNTWEIIVIDDGSSDYTAEVAMGFVEKYGCDKVRLLRMQENVGKGGAVRSGVGVARGKWLLMVDADGATRFSDLERLEKAIKEFNAQVAIGSRVHLRGRGEKEGRGLLRSLMSAVFNWVVVYVGGVKGLADTQCGFKLYSRQAARIAFGGQNLGRWAFDVENLYRAQVAGMKVVEVPVTWMEIPGSKLSLVKATINMLIDMFVMRYNYSTGQWRAPPKAAWA